MKVEYTRLVLKRADEMQRLITAAQVCPTGGGSLLDRLHAAILAILAALSLLIPAASAAQTLLH